MECFSLLLLLVAMVVVVALWLQMQRLLARNDGLTDLLRQLSRRVTDLEAETRGPAAEEISVEKPPAEEISVEVRGPDESPGGSLPLPPVAVSVAASVTAASGESSSPPADLPGDRQRTASEDLLDDDTSSEPFSLETFVGGRLLLVAGVVVVLFGLAFFLKYAIDQEWVGPGARIVSGVLTGLAALWGGDRLRARGLGPFGAALMGGGLGAVYLSIFFAATKYEFIALPTGFGLMAAVTALGAALAVWRRAPLLAYLGFLGGFLAPALLNTGEDALGPLTVWLLSLQAGVLAVTWKRRWQGLDLMALVAAVVYYAGWHDRFLVPEREGIAALALGALCLGLIVVCLLPTVVSGRRMLLSGLVSLVFVSLLGFVAGYDLLHPVQKNTLGVAVLALAVVHLLAGSDLLRSRKGGSGDASLLTALGAAALATAIPVFLDGRPLVVAWSAAGTAAVFIGSRRRDGPTAAAGFLMIALSFVPLFRGKFHEGAFVPFLNAGFWSWVAPCAGMLICGRLLARMEKGWGAAGRIAFGAGVWILAPLLAFEVHDSIRRQTRSLRGMAKTYAMAGSVGVLSVYAVGVAWIARAREGVAAAILPLGPLALACVLGLGLFLLMRRDPFVPGLNPVFLAGFGIVGALVATGSILGGSSRQGFVYTALGYGLFLLTAEIYSHGEHRALEGITRDQALQVAQIWISVVWALYAAALVGSGFWKRRAELRWAGLAIFTLTLGKVFLFDMARLDAIYRIGSFLVLGVMAIGASFLYQRARSPSAERLRE